MKKNLGRFPMNFQKDHREIVPEFLRMNRKKSQESQSHFQENFKRIFETIPGSFLETIKRDFREYLRSVSLKVPSCCHFKKNLSEGFKFPRAVVKKTKILISHQEGDFKINWSQGSESQKRMKNAALEEHQKHPMEKFPHICYRWIFFKKSNDD